MKRICLLFLAFLASCSPSSWEDLRAEGEAETKKLAHLLQGINTKDELQKELPKVKKRLNRMADLVIQVRALKELSPMLGFSEPSEASDELFAQLARLYEMPGCRELIERAQDEPIRRCRVH